MDHFGMVQHDKENKIGTSCWVWLILSFIFVMGKRRLSFFIPFTCITRA